MGKTPARKKAHTAALVLIEHSAAVSLSGPVSLAQRKAFNVLLQHAFDRLPHDDTHTIPFAEFVERTGLQTNNTDYVKELLGSLVGLRVTWDVLEKDRSVEWGTMALLAGAKIRGGQITYGFGPFLKTNLAQPSLYAKYLLLLQNQFTSKYGLVLFELLTDAEYIHPEASVDGAGVTETRWLSLERVRAVMGVPEGAYERWAELKRNVLDPALAEVNRVSDFEAALLTRKEGRAVAQVKFRGRRIPGKGTQTQLALPAPA